MTEINQIAYNNRKNNRNNTPFQDLGPPCEPSKQAGDATKFRLQLETFLGICRCRADRVMWYQQWDAICGNLGFQEVFKKNPWFCEPDFVKNPLLMWRLWQRGLSWDVGLKQVWTCLLVWVEWCLNFKKTLKHKLKKKSPSKYGLFQIEVSNVQERNDGCTTLHHGCTKLWTSSLETQLGVLQKQL